MAVAATILLRAGPSINCIKTPSCWRRCILWKEHERNCRSFRILFLIHQWDSGTAHLSLKHNVRKAGDDLNRAQPSKVYSSSLQNHVPTDIAGQPIGKIPHFPPTNNRGRTEYENYPRSGVWSSLHLLVKEFEIDCLHTLAFGDAVRHLTGRNWKQHIQNYPFSGV